MESLDGQNFEDMRAVDLVRHAKTYMQFIALRPQVERDRAAVVFQELCQDQCYAALELGDEKTFVSYSRAGRFINKYTERYLYGDSFGSVDRLE